MTLSLPRTTRQVCKLVGLRYYQILYLIQSGKLKAPQIDGSRNFAWLEEDVTALRDLLAKRKRKTRTKDET